MWKSVSFRIVKSIDFIYLTVKVVANYLKKIFIVDFARVLHTFSNIYIKKCEEGKMRRQVFKVKNCLPYIFSVRYPILIINYILEFDHIYLAHFIYYLFYTFEEKIRILLLRTRTKNSATKVEYWKYFQETLSMLRLLPLYFILPFTLLWQCFPSKINIPAEVEQREIFIWNFSARINWP